jgi:hypothetical protein
MDIYGNQLHTVYVHIHKLFFADFSCLKLIIYQLIGTYDFRDTSFYLLACGLQQHFKYLNI